MATTSFHERVTAPERRNAATPTTSAAIPTDQPSVTERKPHIRPTRYIRAARAILREIFGPPAQRSFAVRFWDGSVERPPEGRTPEFTVVLKRPGALRRMLLPPSEIAVGEAYLRDDFDVEGNVEAVTALGDLLTGRAYAPASLARLVSHLMSLPSDDLPAQQGQATSIPRPAASRLSGLRHSRRRDAEAVRSHYDVGNDFYALWLDKRMVYSCAYFETGTESLDAAQTAKLEHICRKLRLKPGERLLDIGCGWGGLVQYAAEHYGGEALGITLSERQAEWARSRIKEAGLEGRCRIEVLDYRDLSGVKFDKIVSVGMVEHVGRAKLPTYFRQAYRLLKPGGLFLNHGIVLLTGDATPNLQQRVIDWVWKPGAFVWRYVFPDGELVSPGEIITLAERARFETRDVESLREHYAYTLRHWVRRLEAHHDEAVALVGERIYRVWRLYIAASARGFATGKIGIIQTLLSKPTEDGSSGLPLTRDDLYRQGRPGDHEQMIGKENGTAKEAQGDCI